MSTSIDIDISELAPLRDAIESLSELQMERLMDIVGAEAETQTKRRIASEKRAPDGSAWASWSQGYAAMRHGGQSLLQGEGHLLESITHNVLGPNAVEVGSNLAYARLHNEGGTVRVTEKSRRYFWWRFSQTRDPFWMRMALTKKSEIAIPKRQFLGLSAENEDDIVGIVEDFLAARMAEAGL